MAGELCSPTGFETDHVLASCSTDPRDLTGLTVPSDCDCLVIILGSYDWGPTALTWDQGGAGQSMIQAVTFADGSPTASNRVDEFYVLNPTTGNQTLRIDWSDTPDEACQVTAVYLKNIDVTGTIVDTHGVAGSATQNHSLAGSSDDIAVFGGYDFDGAFTFTDGTLLTSGLLSAGAGCGGDNYYIAGYDNSGSPFTFSVAGGSNRVTVSALYKGAAAAAGRIMSSLVNHGGLAGHGGMVGQGGGLAG